MNDEQELMTKLKSSSSEQKSKKAKRARGSENEHKNTESLVDKSEMVDSTSPSQPSLKVSTSERFREYLTRNKIFFETIAASTLTVMAIVLSWGQLRVTQEQTKYLEQQTTISRAQASPQFVIDFKQLIDATTGSATEDHILIYNQGNIAREIRASTAVFFKLSYLNKAVLKEELVPIFGYYGTTMYSGDATGLVLTLFGRNNIGKRRSIQDNLDLLTEANDVIINLEVKRYVKVFYKDIFNTAYTQYYYVPAVGGAQLLDETDGQVYFENYQSQVDDGTILNLDKMTAQDLYNLFP